RRRRGPRVRPAPEGVRRPAGGRHGERGGAEGAGQVPLGSLQGAPRGRLRGRAAEERDRQGRQAPASRRSVVLVEGSGPKATRSLTQNWFAGSGAGGGAEGGVDDGHAVRPPGEREDDGHVDAAVP